MKKICFFMNTPFTFGGEQRVVSTLANYLQSENYEVSFTLTSKNHQIDYELYSLNKNIKIEFVYEYNSFKNKILRKIFKLISKINTKTGLFSNNLRILKKFYCNKMDEKILLKHFNSKKYDYIIGVASEFFGILAILKPQLKNSKIISWQHSCFNAYYKTPGRRFYNQDSFVKYVLNNTDYYITQTEDDKRLLKEIYSYKSITINNPNSFATNKKSSLTEKRFIAAGRFDFVKKFDRLIEAYYLFKEKNKNTQWKLYIFGDGDNYNECKKLIKKYNLQKEVYLPGKTNKMIDEYLKSSVYLMSSTWEGWGMVVTEAMETGLVTISFDLPCIREIFGDTKSGILIEKFDIQKYAEAMDKIANDEELLKKMSKEAIKRVKEFDISIIGKHWKNLLNGDNENEN